MGSMTPFAECIFLIEIVDQIKGARRARDRLKLAAKAGNAEAVYDDAADLLGHAAIISKILNPPLSKGRSQSALRGEYLRHVLNIDETEATLDRRLRNHLEHIDERLEDWIRKDGTGVYIDKGLPISILAMTEGQIRSLNQAGIYSFLNEQFDLMAIMASLDRIFEAAEERYKLLSLPPLGRDPFSAVNEPRL